MAQAKSPLPKSPAEPLNSFQKASLLKKEEAVPKVAHGASTSYIDLRNNFKASKQPLDHMGLEQKLDQITAQLESKKEQPKPRKGWQTTKKDEVRITEESPIKIEE